MAKLNRRLTVERVMRRATSKEGLDLDAPAAKYTFDKVVRKIGVQRVIDAPAGYLMTRFDEVSSDLPRGYIEDLEGRSVFDNGLTELGVKWLKEIAQKYRGE